MSGQSVISEENLDLAISVLNGQHEAMDLVGGDVAELEETEGFKAITQHTLSQIALDLREYINALHQAKEEMNPNSPQNVQQNENFRGALNQALGFDFM